MSIENAIADAKRIVTEFGFSIDIQFSRYNDTDFVTIKGITSRHNLQFDAEGYPINSTNAHVLVNEEELNEKGVTVRNDRDEVDLTGSIVRFMDGTRTDRDYKVIENQPSETLGLIVLIIARYGTN